jgi:hypothetical protein
VSNQSISDVDEMQGLVLTVRLFCEQNGLDAVNDIDLIFCAAGGFFQNEVSLFCRFSEVADLLVFLYHLQIIVFNERHQ